MTTKGSRASTQQYKPVLSETGLKAVEEPQNINDYRFLIRDDERYTISDIELKDVGQHTHYTFSTTTLKPYMSTRGHSHAGEEVYFIQSGSGTMFLGSKSFHVRDGDVLYVGSDIFHKIINEEARPLVIHTLSPKTVKRPDF